MEGRPPYDDPDDELDFDFDAARRRDPGSAREPDPDEDEPAGGGSGFEDEGFRDEAPAHDEDDHAEGSRGYADEDYEEPGYDAPEDRSESDDSLDDEIPPLRDDEFLDPDTAEQRAIARRRRDRPTGGFKLPWLSGGRRQPRSTAGEGEAGPRRLMRDDPYTPAEVPVPGERRERRRDLPADIRRRQAIALGVIALILIVGIYAIASAIFGGDDDPEPTPLKKLVGQSIIGELGKEPPDQKLLRRVRKGQVGGLIVKPPNEAALAEQLAPLSDAAEEGDNPPLLIMVDQEGGEVKALPGPPATSPQDLGEGGDADAARSEGEQTGSYLAGLGINVDLAPVLDVELPVTADTIASRTFGEDPALVSELGSAFIEGVQSEGVAATAKHFPGLGTATVNTDDGPVEVVAPQEDLDAGIVPFQGAVDAGVEIVMVSSASYPTLGADGPAVFSDPIVNGLLRGQLGFEGLVISDDLQAGGISGFDLQAGSEAVAALQAGVDLLLYARTDQGAVAGFNAAVAAAKADGLSRDQIEATYDRITALKSDLDSD